MVLVNVQKVKTHSTSKNDEYWFGDEIKAAKQNKQNMIKKSIQRPLDNAF